MPSFEGNPFTQQHESCGHETGDSRLSYGENPVSVSPGLDSVLVVTPGQTDRQTDTTDGLTELR